MDLKNITMDDLKQKLNTIDKKTLIKFGSGFVAIIAVFLGDLNAVATVVTLFFLTTYGMINIVNVLEIVAGNPSFRPRIRISWQMSLLAALGCFGVMFLINPLVSVLAFSLELIIYFVLSRRALTTTWVI